MPQKRGSVLVLLFSFSHTFLSVHLTSPHSSSLQTFYFPASSCSSPSRSFRSVSRSFCFRSSNSFSTRSYCFSFDLSAPPPIPLLASSNFLSSFLKCQLFFLSQLDSAKRLWIDQTAPKGVFLPSTRAETYNMILNWEHELSYLCAQMIKSCSFLSLSDTSCAPSQSVHCYTLQHRRTPLH